MIIMSVDSGKARTGIAVSDESGAFAFPKEVIHEYNEEKLIAKICDAALRYTAERIVVGNPVNMNGSEGERSEECRALAAKITEKSGIETVMWDERGTTVSAHAYLTLNGTFGKKRKNEVDAVAAVIILEDYLKHLQNLKNS